MPAAEDGEVSRLRSRSGCALALAAVLLFFGTILAIFGSQQITHQALPFGLALIAGGGLAAAVGALGLLRARRPAATDPHEIDQNNG